MIATSSVVLLGQDAVVIKDHNVRIADVVDLTPLGNEAVRNLSNQIITSLPAGQNSAEYSRAEIVSLVKRRVPGMPVDLIYMDDSFRVKVEQSLTPRPANKNALKSCVKLAHNKLANTLITSEDLVLDTCHKVSSSQMVYYDRFGGVVRARHDLAMNTHLGRLSISDAKIVDRGEDLLLTIKVGPVKIERTVRTLQPLQNAKYIFVHGQDGKIMRVPVSKLSDKRVK